MGNELSETILKWSSYLQNEEVDVNQIMLSKKYKRSSMGAEVCKELTHKDKGFNVTFSSKSD